MLNVNRFKTVSFNVQFSEVTFHMTNLVVQLQCGHFKQEG